jgi:hypothetical protein
MLQRISSITSNISGNSNKGTIIEPINEQKTSYMNTSKNNKRTNNASIGVGDDVDLIKNNDLRDDIDYTKFPFRDLKKRVFSYVDTIDMYRSVVYYHVSFILAMVIIYFTLSSGIDNIYRWISALSFIFATIYSVISGVYISKLLSSWNNIVKNGLEKFWHVCTAFSIKNYRIIREYREVYQYHYKDILSNISKSKSLISPTSLPSTSDLGNRSNRNNHSNHSNYSNSDDSNDFNNSNIHVLDEETKTYVEYVLKNDSTERMENYEWIKASIDRINQYIRMCYYLSFISPNDVLDISGGNLFMNIKGESISNKRNRKLESIVNTLKQEYREELVETWSSVKKHASNGILVLLPCKWIVYEYRNIFRYLHCAKYFKNIYSSFTNDYNDLENTAYELCSTVQELFRHNTINIPKVFLNFHSILTEGIVLCLDNFIALNIVSCFMISGSIIVPLIISVIFHIVSLCIMYYMGGIIDELSKPIKINPELENFDEQIETIFNEMRVLNMEGKSKNRF